MKIGVIGAGTMGQGIAKAFAQVEGNTVAQMCIRDRYRVVTLVISWGTIIINRAYTSSSPNRMVNVTDRALILSLIHI